MKRKDYKKPMTVVVEVKQQSHLLQASMNGDVKATMNGTFVEEDI